MAGKVENTSVRMSGTERRMQILQVAIGLFSRQGFSGTTTKEIAEEAGISEAMVFKHFANKHLLYRAILDEKACGRAFKQPEGVNKFAEERNDFGFFYTLALKMLCEHKSDTSFLRLMIHSALEEHELAKTFAENFLKQIYDYVGTYVELRQREGAFKGAFKPRVAVRAFFGMVVNHSLNNILWDKEQRILKISDEEAAREFATIFLSGISKTNINEE